MAEFDFSSGISRLGKAMSAGSDEVPFIAQMHEFSMRESGQPGYEFYTDARKFVRGICEVTERFGFDTPSFIWDVYNIEAEALGCHLVTFEDMAPAIENTTPLVASDRDLLKLKSPDPYSAARMPMVFEIMQAIKDIAGMTPLPCYCAPFTLASHIMTFESLIVQMQENPGFVHRIMTFLVDEVLTPYQVAMHKAFPESPLSDGSDAVASLPFITQDMLEEFSLQYIERLSRNLQASVGKIAINDNWWGDSFATDLEKFWEQKLRATPEYLKVQDPDLWKVGVDPVVEYASARNLPIVLGVDNNLYQSGEPDEIRRRTHEYMEAVETNGGRGAVYMCSLSGVTPRENVVLAIESMKEFRAGIRPWAGLKRAGTAEALGKSISKGKDQIVIDPREVAELAANVSTEEKILDDIFDAVLDAGDADVVRLVREALDNGMNVHEVLNEGLIAAMDEVGDEFASGRIFVPEMLMSARAMKAGLEVVRPVLTETGVPSRGKVLLATVQGDVHDIGKNLVGMMLEGAGYEVIDLGVNKSPDEIFASANEIQPNVVGLSALLTTSMPSMQKTVALFKSESSRYPVIVGGAPVTGEYASVIGADGYGENAPHAVEIVHHIVQQQETRVEGAVFELVG